MTRYRYYGGLQRLYSVSQRYQKEQNSDYFSDLILIHTALGLSVRYKSVTAVAHINAKKDYEVMLISDKVNHQLFELLYIVMEVFHEDLQLYCTSNGIMFPPLGESEGVFPAVMRVVSRGS